MFALGIGLLLGLRHSTDPDHLTAVSTLVASDDDRSAGRAARLGAAMVRRFEQAAPLLGSASLAFGVWYGLAAL